MKIAVFNYEGKSSKVGGPRGYLSNLFDGLEGMMDAPDFVSERKSEKIEVNLNSKPKSDNEKSDFLQDIRIMLSILKKGFKIFKEFHNTINQYNVIHTHSCEDCYYLKKFAKFRGSVILTSHRPEPLADERLPKYKDKKYFSFAYLFYKHIEKLGYRYADAYIFPSRGACEIYNSFPGFADASKNKPIGYVMTGTRKKTATCSRNEYRKKNGLEDNDYIISYIGRHNKIKGYDRLINAFPKLKKENIKVVSAGAPSAEFKPPVADEWLELGYISDAIDLMSASDIIVIPNRNTYYDLVIVEAISTGTIVVSSNTGGNTDIAKYTSGLVLFDNNDENSLMDVINRIKRMSEEERNMLKEDNLRFYNEYGDIKKFAENYLETLKSICEDLKNV